MKPTIGRSVHYKLSAGDAEAINRSREVEGVGHDASWPKGAQAHVGNNAAEGQVFPMHIVNVFDTTPVMVNGQVLLDGNDVLWATSVAEGDNDGEWQWPPRV